MAGAARAGGRAGLRRAAARGAAAVPAGVPPPAAARRAAGEAGGVPGAERPDQRGTARRRAARGTPRVGRLQVPQMPGLPLRARFLALRTHVLQKVPGEGPGARAPLRPVQGGGRRGGRAAPAGQCHPQQPADQVVPLPSEGFAAPARREPPLQGEEAPSRSAEVQRSGQPR